MKLNSNKKANKAYNSELIIEPNIYLILILIKN